MLGLASKRVSTNDQQTPAMQNRAMREYAARRGWTIALDVREVNSQVLICRWPGIWSERYTLARNHRSHTS